MKMVRDRCAGAETGEMRKERCKIGEQSSMEQRSIYVYQFGYAKFQTGKCVERLFS